MRKKLTRKKAVVVGTTTEEKKRMEGKIMCVEEVNKEGGIVVHVKLPKVDHYMYKQLNKYKIEEDENCVVVKLIISKHIPSNGPIKSGIGFVFNSGDSEYIEFCGGFEIPEDENEWYEKCINNLTELGIIQTLERNLASVQKDGHELVWVKKQTPEICLAAVQQNGLALLHVKEQTPELCLAAVQQNGLALKYVKKQTAKICAAAVLQNKDAFQYIKD